MLWGVSLHSWCYFGILVSEINQHYLEEGERMAGKNKGGRPPKYSTPAEMEEVVEQYFEDCEEKIKTDAAGKPVFDRTGRPVMYRDKIPTISGLSRALGFRSRQSLLDYQAKRLFRDIILDAKLRVEIFTEEQLFTRDGCNGAKFVLWNSFGWRPAAEEKEPAGIRIIYDVP